MYYWQSFLMALVKKFFWHWLFVLMALLIFQSFINAQFAANIHEALGAI
jgi:hypothetical protein